jgi:small subunit ribosomal protein S20
VANHPSAQKRNRQRITRTARNRAVSSTVRTHLKRVRAAIAEKDQKGAKAALKAAISQIDKASSKGVVHRKAASRTIARLSAQVHKLSSAGPNK